MFVFLKEYKKNKAQIIQQLEEHDKKREEFVKQLKSESLKQHANLFYSRYEKPKYCQKCKFLDLGFNFMHLI